MKYVFLCTEPTASTCLTGLLHGVTVHESSENWLGAYLDALLRREQHNRPSQRVRRRVLRSEEEVPADGEQLLLTER